MLNRARPESAYHNARPASRPIPSNVYERFSQFIEAEDILKTSFYPRESATVSKELFENCFRIVSFSLTEQELDVIWQDLGGVENEVIDLSQFYSKLSCWKDNLDKDDEDAMDGLNADFFQVLL